ncbi:recombinase family protein [Streptomyces sp. NPDC001508]|uniref:recombinase family protein n=1 Tax=Streptomyces sp. NPDC001508 TaxID=3154656 RepID=UPI003323B255
MPAVPPGVPGVHLGAELRERGIGLHVIEQSIGTCTMEGRAMFGMLFVLAELQCELIVANTGTSTRPKTVPRRPKKTTVAKS